MPLKKRAEGLLETAGLLDGAPGGLLKPIDVSFFREVVETVLSLAPKRPPRGSSLRRVAPAVRNDGPARFERILALSTGHLSKEEADLLDDGSCRPTRRRSGPADGGSLRHVVCAEDEYGWFVHVPGDDRALREIATADKMPILARVLKRATALGADWVKFDADASTLEGLEIFDW